MYQPRIIDVELARLLKSSGAVVMEGPKACGKTASCQQVAASSAFLDVDTTVRGVAELDPLLALQGAVPRLIDEWQLVPGIWNAARHLVDERSTPGQFILTGSAVPADDATRHSGAGRFSRLRMRPMSLYETGHSNGAVSLSALLSGARPRCPDPGLTYSEIADRITVGGWPALQSREAAEAARVNRDYIDQISRTDVNRVDGGRRDPGKVARLMSSLARNVGTEVTITTLSHDAAGSDGDLSRNTTHDYLEVLDRLMIVENQPAWDTHLRSKAVQRHAPKRHFTDPSLAVAALRASPARLLADPNFLGLLFESLVIRDLRTYSQPLDAGVYHYRDGTGLEVDAIVQAVEGAWGAFEVKLNPAAADKAAASLLRFASKIDTARCGDAAFLAVIVGTGYAYVRPDGVAVVPIGALGP